MLFLWERSGVEQQSFPSLPQSLAPLVCCFSKERCVVGVPTTLADLSAEWNELAAATDMILWQIIHFSLVWFVWLGRNDTLFKDKSFTSQEIWDLHLLRAIWWVKGSWPGCPYDMNHFSQKLRGK